MHPSFYKAAMPGSVGSLNKLAERDLSVLDSRTSHGNTALHIAAELGHARFAKELLDMNSELLVSTNANGDTPLHLDARAGKLDAAALLIALAKSWPEHSAANQTKAPSTERMRWHLFMVNK